MLLKLMWMLWMCLNGVHQTINCPLIKSLSLCASSAYFKYISKLIVVLFDIIQSLSVVWLHIITRSLIFALFYWGLTDEERSDVKDVRDDLSSGILYNQRSPSSPTSGGLRESIPLAPFFKNFRPFCLTFCEKSRGI